MFDSLNAAFNRREPILHTPDPCRQHVVLAFQPLESDVRRVKAVFDPLIELLGLPFPPTRERRGTVASTMHVKITVCENARMHLVTCALLLVAATAAAADTPMPNSALAARAADIVKSTDGTVGFAVLDIETGQMTSVNGKQALPLYSVFKLPVAITILREVAAGRMDLERKVHVEPKDALLGASKANDERWSRPVETTVRELIGWSIVHSDNTAVDTLLGLLGGTEKVAATMTELGFPAIQVKSTVRGMRGLKGAHPNVASAEDLVRLLAALHAGKVLKEPQRGLLLGFMSGAVTGLDRIRAGVPAGTKVGDKTGTGPDTANDVGIVTLPGESAHLAIAVLVTGGKRLDAMEMTIADLSRATYDTYVARQPVRGAAIP
jgi:beta-lactamase class A